MKSVFPLVLGIAICVGMVYGATFGALRGIVHDPDHRPVPSAGITVRSSNSDLLLTAITNADGTFELAGIKPGAYILGASVGADDAVYGSGGVGGRADCSGDDGQSDLKK